MTILGAPREYYQKWKFVVRIDQIPVGSFQSCSELSCEFAEVTQWEGGAMIPSKAPGRMTFDDLTLSRGVTGSPDLYLWYQSVGVANANAGLVAQNFKRGLDIVQLDRMGGTAQVARVFNAWPKRFVAGDWDNDADENRIEQLVLAYDYFEFRTAPVSIARGTVSGR